MIPKYFLGLDVGQAEDPSAMGLIELVRTPVPVDKIMTEVQHLRLIGLERLALGTLYPDVVAKVKRNVEAEPLTTRQGECVTELIFDATGVGRPIVDMARKVNLKPIAVTITGGEVEKHEDWRWRVPKRNLVMALNLVLQTDKLEIAAGLDEIGEFKEQMRAFTVKLSAAGHDSYEADGAKMHDDLVIAVLLPVWRALKFMPKLWQLPKPLPTPKEWSKLYQDKLSDKLRRASA